MLMTIPKKRLISGTSRVWTGIAAELVSSALACNEFRACRSACSDSGAQSAPLVHSMVSAPRRTRANSSRAAQRLECGADEVVGEIELASDAVAEFQPEHVITNVPDGDHANDIERILYLRRGSTLRSAGRSAQG